jgi:hypothetical protein
MGIVAPAGYGKNWNGEDSHQTGQFYKLSAPADTAFPGRVFRHLTFFWIAEISHAFSRIHKR